MSEFIGYSEEFIQQQLHAKYSTNCKYKVENVYLFKHDWESDFVVQKNNGYCYEFEIKITRADYFNDFRKTDKHVILKHGKYVWDTLNWKEREHKFRPNKFFFIVPKGLISIEEVPEYCGLMFIESNKIETIREAPFIHKSVLELEKKLCGKFYHRIIDLKRENRQLQEQLKVYTKDGKKSI